MKKQVPANRQPRLERFAELCAQEGFPTPDDQGNFSPPLLIRVVGKVKQLNDVASRMIVYLNHQDITFEVACLAGLRLCKGDTIIIRSGSGEQGDIRELATIVSDLYAEGLRAAPTGQPLQPVLAPRDTDAGGDSPRIA
ncbi:hypothetical protein [Acidithiobacillus sp.]|uniref:hypothetical protein n=1 Tax=Acidithiobacillus sp. TaxID=1872118 RepID=UPI0031FED8C7